MVSTSTVTGIPWARAMPAARATAGVSCPSMCSSRAQAICSSVISSASMRRQSSRRHSTVRSPVDWSMMMYAD